MNIACLACPARYAAPDEKIIGRRVRIACKRCGTALIVDGTTTPPSVLSEAPASSRQPPPPLSSGPASLPASSQPSRPSSGERTLGDAYEDEDEATRIVQSPLDSSLAIPRLDAGDEEEDESTHIFRADSVAGVDWSQAAAKNGRSNPGVAWREQESQAAAASEKSVSTAQGVWAENGLTSSADTEDEEEVTQMMRPTEEQMALVRAHREKSAIDQATERRVELASGDLQASTGQAGAERDEEEDIPTKAPPPLTPPRRTGRLVLVVALFAFAGAGALLQATGQWPAVTAAARSFLQGF